MVAEHRKRVWCGLLDGEVAQLPLIVKCCSFLTKKTFARLYCVFLFVFFAQLFAQTVLQGASKVMD